MKTGGAVVLLYILLLPALAAAQTSARAQETAEGRNWLGGIVGVSTLYNDNLLDYSPGDLLLLDNSLKPAKFAVKRSFDVLYGLRARINFSPDLLEGENTTVHVRFGRWFDAVNSIRDFTSWGGGIKQSFWKKNYIAAGFNVLPSYYLRSLYYSHLRSSVRLRSQYLEAWLEKHSYSMELGRQFNSRLTCSVGYEQIVTDYNQEFTERGNRTHSVTLDAAVKITHWLRTEAGAGHAISWAKGRTMSDSLSDISYRAETAHIGATILLKPLLGVPLEFSSDLLFEYQTFLSGKIYNMYTRPWGDKYHYGRIDRFYRLVSELDYHVLEAVEVTLQYAWDQNTTNLPETGDAGSYLKHEVGGGVRVSF